MIDEEEKIIQAEEETQESLKQKSVFHAELSDCQIGSKRLADVRNDLIHAVQEPQDHLSSLGEAEVERREQRQSTGEVLNEEVEEEREEQQQAAGLCGLENPTASVCYFNSGLQCLLACTPLRNAILNGVLDKLMGDVATTTTHDFVRDFEQIVGYLWYTTNGHMDASQFRSAFYLRHPEFASTSIHHDTQEMLVQLIDSLHDGMKKKPPGRLPPLPNPKDSLQRQANAAWKRLKSLNLSPIFDIFYGLTISKLRCGDCCYESISFEPFSSLQLSIPAEDEVVPVNLSDCLDLYCQPENVLNVECSKCKSTKSKKKDIKVQRLPPLLMIFFTRMVGTTGKIQTHVDYPVTDFLMAPWCHANCNVPHEPYQLTAVATHVGTLEHGHNTAIVNNPTVPFWLEFNDKKIKSIPTSAVVVRKVISTYFVPLEH